MVWRWLDTIVDRGVLTGSRQVRRVSHKVMTRGHQALQMWIVYQSRRRKDPMVKYTTVLACYCFYCIARSIALVCNDSGLEREPPRSYWDDLRRLDEYNLKGRVDTQHNAMVDIRLSREDSLVFHDQLAQRTY